MSLKGPNPGSMTVWCPIIPEDDLKRLSSHQKGLQKISEAFYDWQASMRGKPIVGTTIGVLLDRVRMLMINLGIAVGQQRDLAEDVQKVISEKLRAASLRLVSKLPSDSPEDKAVKKTLAVFFARIKFTRDIDPLEDMRASMPDLKTFCSQLEEEDRMSMFGVSRTDDLDDVRSAEIKLKVTKMAVSGSTNVIKRIFLRLLSPDPWDND